MQQHVKLLNQLTSHILEKVTDKFTYHLRLLHFFSTTEYFG